MFGYVWICLDTMHGSYLYEIFHTNFILISYVFILWASKGYTEAGLGPVVGSMGPWPGPPHGAKDLMEAQSTNSV